MEHEITYTKPAEEWMDGLPLGNGDIGAMVFGAPWEMKVLLNKMDIWDNRFCGNKSNMHARTFHEVRAAVERGDAEWLKNADHKTRQVIRKPGCPSFQPAGILEVEFGGGGSVSYMRQVLSLDRGTVESHWRVGGEVFETSCFVNVPDDVLTVALRNKGGRVKKATVRLYRLQNDELPSPRFKVAGEAAALQFCFPDGLRYAIAVVSDSSARLRATDRRVTIVVTIPAGEQARLFLSIGCSEAEENPLDGAVSRALGACRKSYETLVWNHEAWWRQFWSQSSVSLPDSKLEMLWYFALYAMACCSRSGKQAPGLQGAWSIENAPPWHADYHLDCNIQAAYWPIYTGNHLELGEPFYRLFCEMLPQVKQDTEKYYGIEGASFPCMTNKSGKSIGGYVTTDHWPGKGAWVAQHYWWHYAYSCDMRFLRVRAYPFMKECVAFYEGYLRKDRTGRYEIYPTNSPEQGENGFSAWGRNDTITIVLIKELLANLIEASTILKVDAKHRVKWKRMLKRLPPYPTRKGYLTDMEGRDFRESHRHMSALAPIYPCDDISLNSTKRMFKLGLASYRDTLSKGFKAYFGFSFPWLACIAARLGLGRDAVKMLRRYLDTFVDRNLFSMSFDFRLRLAARYDKEEFARLLARPPGKVLQLESSSIAGAAVNEMLLQSQGGKMRVFPAVPPGWTASFKSLRARGGFLISASMKRGRVRRIEVDSTCGGVLEIVNPFSISRVVVEDVKAGEARRLRVPCGRTIRLKTRAARCYVISRSD